MSALQIVWFLLVGVLLCGYAILDGFDLGTGIWHLRARTDAERRALLASIGPVWDGNEVWLLTGGGALFAAFPFVYATVFSGMYLALIVVLLGLIFRAVAIEVRSKEESPGWRSAWDWAFALGSGVPALLFGVALGNVMRGLELTPGGDHAGGFFDLLNPYSLLIGLLGLAMFAVHGAAWIAFRIEGDLARRALAWGKGAWWVYLALFLAVDIATVATQAHLLGNYFAVPGLWIVPFFTLSMIALIRIFLSRAEAGRALLASSLSIAGLWLMAGVSLFPDLVVNRTDPGLSLSIVNSSSTPLTLSVMLVIALVGMPLVLGYTIWVYRLFGGKIRV